MEPDEISSLLRRYAADGSDEAFFELVQRYMNLVHGAAVRRLNGDAALAEDVVQRVFMELAREARRLRHGAGLGGWLYRRAVHLAADMQKGERRRAARERVAAGMSSADDAAADAPNAWDEVQPHLEDAIGNLSAADRDAVVLRFIENRPLRSVGAALGVSEDAAQKRISRALEKLRRYLCRRGMGTTAAALALTLSKNSAPAVANPVLRFCQLTAAGAAKKNCAAILFHAIAMKPVAVTAVFILAAAGVAIPLLLPSRAERARDRIRSQAPPSPPGHPEHQRAGPQDQAADDAVAAAPLPARRASGIPLLPGLTEQERAAALKSARARAEKQTLERFEEKMARLREKFGLTTDQEAAIAAHHRAQRNRWIEYLTGAAVGEAAPGYYHLDNSYRPDIPPHLAGILTPAQREILTTHETTRRANFLEATTNGELGSLALKLELSESAKDALFDRLSHINGEDLFADYTGITDIEGIARQADHDIARRRESFAGVLDESQMRLWESVAASYRAGLLRRFGYREPEAMADVKRTPGGAG